MLDEGILKKVWCRSGQKITGSLITADVNSAGSPDPGLPSNRYLEPF